MTTVVPSPSNISPGRRFVAVFLRRAAVGFVILCGINVAQAQIRWKRLPARSGTIVAVFGDRVTIQLADSSTDRTYQVQVSEDEPLMVDGRRLSMPARIRAQGPVPISALSDGAMVVADVRLAKGGRVIEPIEQLTWVVDDQLRPSMVAKDDAAGKTAGELRNADKKGWYRVTGSVFQRREDRLVVSVPRHRLAPGGRLSLPLTREVQVLAKSTSLSLVRAGDKVAKFEAVEFTPSLAAIRSLVVELAPQSSNRTLSVDDQLAAKYAAKSDEPSRPREVRSRNFLLQTDLSDRQAAILLDKLETMIRLVSEYYRRPPRGVIRGYVVRDLKQWPKGSIQPIGLVKIASREGVTITRTLGTQRQSIVYACDDHQVVQHESVHAYCNQTLGGTGPTWYSEGMAEMGAYWKEGERAVQIRSPVIDYLTHAEPKKLLDIVAAGQITGDSWQAYGWRWAICHLLASNPNYAKRFKRLGKGMMAGERVTFESAFGDVAAEISFEYDQFVANFGNGYRADLCAWQWKPAKALAPKARVRRTVEAAAGWQAARVRVAEKKTYEYLAEGTWQTSPASEPISADGRAASDENSENESSDLSSTHGCLMAVVLTDSYTLSKPFPLGTRGTFVAPVSGRLYLRCQDSWTQISDNQGSLDVFLRQR